MVRKGPFLITANNDRHIRVVVEPNTLYANGERVEHPEIVREYRLPISRRARNTKLQQNLQSLLTEARNQYGKAS